jgi:hypothetical protein
LVAVVNVYVSSYIATPGDSLLLACSAYDYDYLGNDLIGSCEVDVSWLLAGSVALKSVHFPLNDPEKTSATTGKPLSAGTIVCQVDAAVVDM